MDVVSTSVSTPKSIQRDCKHADITEMTAETFCQFECH